MGNSSDGCTVQPDLALENVRALQVNSGDVVVISATEADYDDTAARAWLLREMFEASGIEGTLILVLRPGMTLEVLPEDRMRELGWVRASSDDFNTEVIGHE